MLFAATILLSAFLLFQVQPLIARMILPWFGGSAAVWTACMLFFQAALVAGYLYSHALTRLAPRRQAAVHIALLAVALATLPIVPSPAWKVAAVDDPTVRIIMLLGTSVGLPYFLLSATSPLVQSWFARHRPGITPYRLFALSNLGSLIALVSYPLVFEPLLTLRQQSWAWSGGFGAFAMLGIALAYRSRTLPPQQAAAGNPIDDRPPRREAYLLWILLPACASVLLLACTTHLTQNIAPIPFLWVLPLVLYLLSFIVCFDHSRWYQRRLFLPLLALSFIAVCVTLVRGNVHQPLWILISLYAGTLFIACMICHGELARMKPHPRWLTGYYLMIAIGGALGGFFVGVVAPAVFTGLYELPVGMVATVLVAAAALSYDRTLRPGVVPAYAIAASGIFAGALTVALWKIYAVRNEDAIAAARNFYAALRVDEDGVGDDRQRLLTNGTITHGKQFLKASRRDWPTSYYAEDSGVGLAIASRRATGEPIKIGMIGLGAGTLATYGRKGDVVRIYEINPLVRRIAQRYFTYLSDSQAKLEFAMGDARLSLEQEAPQSFDVLAVDAFTSDAIPVHLLTLEAFATYFRHLKPGGILAVHVSNRYLDLEPVVALAAETFHAQARTVQNESDEARGTYSSSWVLVAQSGSGFAYQPLARAAQPVDSSARVRRWTDDYTDLLSILK